MTFALHRPEMQKYKPSLSNKQRVMSVNQKSIEIIDFPHHMRMPVVCPSDHLHWYVLFSNLPRKLFTWKPDYPQTKLRQY